MTYWIVNPFDDLPNEGGSTQRFWNLARELASCGHKVVWWSMDFSHRLKVRRQPCPEISGVEIRLISVPEYRQNISISRIINHAVLGVRFYHQACEVMSRCSEHNVTILLSMPPLETCFSALKLKAMFPGVRVLVDIMDAWPDVLVEVICRRTKILKPIARGVLLPYYLIWRKILKEVDAITAVNQEFLEMVKRNGYNGKFKVVYTGCDLIPEDLLDAKWQKMRIEKKTNLKIAYVGSMGRVYDLASVYSAIKLLRDEGLDIKMEVAGGSSNDTKNQTELCSKLGISDHVVFHGFLGGDDLVDMLLRCHIGLIPMFRESLVAFPYKARDYAGAGLPMINSLGWDIEELIKKYDAGWQYKAGDQFDLADIIRRAAHGRRGLIEKAIGSRKMAVECFEKKKNYAEWCLWLDRLVKSSR